MSTIRIIESSVDQGIKHGLPSLGKGRTKETEVDLSLLHKNLEIIISDFQCILDKSAESKSKYNVDEVELNLSVNSKGSVALIGKLEAGMQASIKVKLKRDQCD